MKNIIKSLAMAVGLSAVVLQGATAQGSEEYGSGLKVNLNDTGSKYVRFIIWNQVWLRAIQNNDNTIVNGVEEKWTYDAAIRRARFLAYAQISPRFMVLTHFGINNQTFVTGGVPNGGVTGNGGNYTSGKKPGIFFHDLWNEYAVVPQKNLKTGEARDNSLYVGSGLHYWHGLSRMTNASYIELFGSRCANFQLAYYRIG